MEKTNAMRLLDAAGIGYTVKTYAAGDARSGLDAARLLGIPPERVFKTLALQAQSGGGARETGKGRYLVCCIPAAEALDLKKAARIAGEKKVDLIPQKDLLAVTGYVRGGCSPIGMKKPFPTYVDESAELWETIAVSAGVRGCQMLLAGRDLLAYTSGVLADLTER
ncbi:MAG: Cys-tRNA(Pro) deacylase [Treponema sp.]|jgi:Cys-tRNA(Pro)/Cys-tRNA(Cys) deacylase|nr:Cys-tRNA(Pro) deacylase [Treponema sp.]